MRELLALLGEGVELLEESVRDLGRLLDGGGVARVKLRVDRDSLVDDVLDDGLSLADEGGDALDRSAKVQFSVSWAGGADRKRARHD